MNFKVNLLEYNYNLEHNILADDSHLIEDYFNPDYYFFLNKITLINSLEGNNAPAISFAFYISNDVQLNNEDELLLKTTNSIKSIDILKKNVTLDTLSEVKEESYDSVEFDTSKQSGNLKLVACLFCQNKTINKFLNVNLSFFKHMGRFIIVKLIESVSIYKGDEALNIDIGSILFFGQALRRNKEKSDEI